MALASTAANAIRSTTIIPYLEQLYINARAKKRQYYAQWRRNYLLLNSRMWAEFRPQWMPNPTDSEIYPICSTLIAWMMDQDVSFSIAPAANAHTPFATYMQKLSMDLQVLLESNWLVNKWARSVDLSLWDAAQCGSGILKAGWDGGSDQGLGNAMLTRVDPWAFYPDPNATSTEDSNYFIEYRRMSFEEIQRRFPLAYEEVEQNMMILMDGGQGPSDEQRPFLYDNGRYPIANPAAMPSGTFQNPGPSHTSGSYGLPGASRQNNVLIPGVNVYECWLRENWIEDDPPDTDPLSDLSQSAPSVSDRWRVVVHAAGVVLMDEYAEDLYEYSRHPYGRFCYDDIGEFWGISLVTHLSGPQIAINRLLSSMQQNAEITGNPILLEPANSGMNRNAITNKPGERIQVNTGAGNNQKPEWMQPPTMPPYIQELINFWIARMENISGITGISKGQTPQGRATNSTVTSVQESGFVRIRAGLRNLEDCLRDMGNMLAQLIIQNYTVPRTVAIVGSSGIKTTLSLAARHFYSPYRDKDGQRLLPLKYSLLVTAGANNPTSRSARIAESDTLFAMGAIDQQAILEAHNYPNWQDIVQRMQQQQMQLALAGQLSGQQSSGSGSGKRVRSKRKT